MKEISLKFAEFVPQIDMWVWALIAIVIVVIIMVLIVMVRRRKILKTALSKLELNQTDPAFTEKLLSRPSIIETLIRKKGDIIISHFGVLDHLVRKLDAAHRTDHAKRILKLAPKEGAFHVFLLALKKESIFHVFKSWVQEINDILVIREMALTAHGRDFDGHKAKKLLSSCFEGLRELSGDPEWPVRFFAVRVLLSDSDPKSIRLLKAAFSDPHPLIRKTVASEIAADDPEELFGALMNMVLDDPVPEVRRSARKRIDSLFPERWRLDPAGMNALQSVHVLELLKIGSKEDENVAISALRGKTVESRLAAARFLEKSGSLERILTEANRGDREDWERRRDLLSKAVSVGVTGFLEKIKGIEKTDVLLLGAKLLTDGGDNRLIGALASKAFGRTDPIKEADEEELYRTAMTLACVRGDDSARALVRDELRARKKDGDVLGFILPLLPPGEAPVFRDVLLEFLADPDFPADETFVSIMVRLPSSMFLGKILDILESDRAVYSHNVRLRALKCLAGWHLDQTLQILLENLPILPLEEARSFAPHLAAINQKAFEERAGFILSSPDSGIRAALIASLPANYISVFGARIREGLKDADPDVRIACLRALMDADELKATPQVLDLIRDPVERVRCDAARAAGIKATEKFIGALRSILTDMNESPAVRNAALEGLSASTAKESVDVMVEFLYEGRDLREELIAAMAAKTDKKSITALVEHFKDSEAVLRDRIAAVFKAMGESGEEALVNLLKEDIGSIKPLLADILTRTGFVEILIRRLGHRKPEVRRDAAELLAQIATESAYRGIVLAARDPDREVRIKVTKALESLASPEGENILKSLQNDPDKKVRKYTYWALERLKAKKLP